MLQLADALDSVDQLDRSVRQEHRHVSKVKPALRVQDFASEIRVPEIALEDSESFEADFSPGVGLIS